MGVPADPARALHWYRRAAAQEYAPAQYMVGALLDRDEDGAHDPLEACNWYRKAAEQGHALAQFALALRYDCGGAGIDQDYPQAHHWYLAAASQGHVRAQFNVGVMYSAGQGVARDLLKAYAWLARAGQAGEAAAKAYLKRVASRMDPALLEQVRRYTETA
jgi:TPR repeat protein